MPFNSALSAGNLTSLRGSSSIPARHVMTTYLSVCPNNNIYTARVNQASFSTSFAQLLFDGGAGTLANVRVGMTVLISHTNDRAAAFFAGRIRLAPSNPILYINETSAPIADNDYIFILDDYRIFDKLARFASDTLYVDYDRTFRKLLPRISNLRSAYAVFTSGATGQFSFAATAAAMTQGATISTYLWEIGDGTFDSGSSSTASITASFPVGFRWIHLTVTDSGGRQSTRHIPVWVENASFANTLLNVGDLQISASVEDGYSASVAAFDGVETLLDNTLVCIWQDAEVYNATATTIVNNIAFVGRFRSGKSATDYADGGQYNANLRYDLEGAIQTLNRLEMTSVEIRYASTATKFCEVEGCAPFREAFLILSEFSTFHELHSIYFDEADNTFNDLGVAAPSGSLLNAVNSVMFSLNSALQMNSAGQAEFVRDASMRTTAGRNALTTVADWTTADILALEYDHEHVNIIGRALGSGGAFNTTSKKITPVNSIAPGVAQDYPEGSTSLDRQVLAANAIKTAAQDELNVRLGHYFASKQGIDELNITHPDGYWFLTPALDQWYTFTLDGTETVFGLVLTTAIRWQLVSIQAVYDLERGTQEVQATYRRETSGAAAQTIVYPPQTSVALTLPTFPPLPPFPPFDIGNFFLPDDLSVDLAPPALAGTIAPQGVRHDGNTVMVWTATQVWFCNDFISQPTPAWIEITPNLESGETIVQCRFIPGSPPGALIMTNMTTPFDIVYDFALSDGGWINSYAALIHGGGGVYTPGSGWASSPMDLGFGEPAGDYIYINISGVTAATIIYDLNDAAHSNGNGVDFRTWSGADVTGSLVENFTDSITPGSSVTARSYTHAFTTPGKSFLISQNQITSALWRKITLTISGATRVWRTTNVFDGGASMVAGGVAQGTCELMRIGSTFSDIYIWDATNGNAYYSANRGASWGDAIAVGTPPASDPGFDTQRLGAVTLAGMTGKVRAATTQGGAYADYTTLPASARPTAIFIPRWKLSGANNGIGISAPDYIFASDTLDASSHSLWKVTAGGVTITDITPSSGGFQGLAVSPNCLAMSWASGGYLDILAILSFSGTRKLARSINGGTAWVFTAALNSAANFVTTRRSDTLHRQAFITNGVVAGYTSNYQSATPAIASRTTPALTTLLGIEVLP